jgi:hypothetical protein
MRTGRSAAVVLEQAVALEQADLLQSCEAIRDVLTEIAFN